MYAIILSVGENNYSVDYIYEFEIKQNLVI